MKNFIKIFVVFVILLTVAIILFNLFQLNRIINIAENVLSNSKNERVALARAVAVQNDIATFKTADGFYWEWEIEPNETFTPGANYYLTFNTLGTISIQDDIIVNIVKGF